MTLHTTAVALWVALLLAGGTARAQSGGAYDLRHNTIDGGGATATSSSANKLGGTIGQPDAGRLSSAAYSITGGFWAGIQVSTPTPTRTPSFTATATASVTPTPIFTAVATASVTSSPSPSRAPTETFVPTSTPSNTASPSPIQSPTRSPTHTTGTSNTPTATPTPSPTESPRVTPADACVGDCDRDDEVTIAELLRMVNIALGDASVDTCEAGDSNHDRLVTINEILQAVSNALAGCE